MKLFYTSLISILCLCIGQDLLLAQQSPVFQQYSLSPELFNPARIGEAQPINLSFIQRQQWIGIQDGPSSQLFSFSYRLPNRSPLAFGIVAKNDRASLLKRTDAALFAGYHFEGYNNRFSIGVYGGINSLGVAVSDINVDLDPAATVTGARRTKLDAGIGLNFHHENESSSLDIGLSAMQIPGTFEFSNEAAPFSFSMVNHLMANISWRYSINDQLAIEPIVLFRTLPGSQKLKGGAFDVQLRFLLDRLGLGLGARPDAGSLFASLSIDLDREGKSRFIGVGEYHPELNYSYEVGASLGFGTLPPLSAPTSKPKTMPPTPKEPTTAVIKEKPTREAFWNSTKELNRRIRTSRLETFADVRAQIDLKGTQINIIYPDTTTDYLLKKPSTEDRLITWTVDLIKEILRDDISPYLESIDSLVLIANFVDPSSIIEAEVASIPYRGEWGDITDTYLFEGQVQDIQLRKSEDLLFMHEFSFLRLHNLRQELARKLGRSPSSIKIKLRFEQEISSGRVLQIRAYLPPTKY